MRKEKDILSYSDDEILHLITTIGQIEGIKIFRPDKKYWVKIRKTEDLEQNMEFAELEIFERKVDAYRGWPSIKEYLAERSSIKFEKWRLSK